MPTTTTTTTTTCQRPGGRLPLGDALRLTGGAMRDTVRAEVPGTQRGVALLVVLVTMAIMGALSVEFAYNTRTNIWMAGNVTASARAFYHARSVTEIAVLAVNAKRNFPQIKTALTLMGKAGGAKAEIWRQACEFAKIFFTGRAEFFGMDILDLTDEPAVGIKDGSFECSVTAEDSRTNLNAASTDPPNRYNPTGGRGGNPRSPGGAAGARGATGANPRAGIAGLISGGVLDKNRKKLGYKLYGLLRPFLDSGEIDSEDEMIEIIVNVMDWTDADDVKTDVGPNGEFIESSGSEASDYGQYGYGVKNAKMDSVGEVQLVEGMTSDIYCKIKDKLTVFSTGKLNVNDADPAVLKGVLCQALKDESQRLAMCWNPLPGQPQAMDLALQAMESCRQLKKQAYSTPFTSVAAFSRFFKQFPTIMQIPVQLDIDDRMVREHLGVLTNMVRVEATGSYRGTTRKVTTVIDQATGEPVYTHIE